MRVGPENCWLQTPGAAGGRQGPARLKAEADPRDQGWPQTRGSEGERVHGGCDHDETLSDPDRGERHPGDPDHGQCQAPGLGYAETWTSYGLWPGVEMKYHLESGLHCSEVCHLCNFLTLYTGFAVSWHAFCHREHDMFSADPVCEKETKDQMAIDVRHFY